MGNNESFAYDDLGRMVGDTTFIHPSLGGGSQTSILSFTYNQVGLTQNISSDGSLLVKYLYLADGMKTSARHSDGSGLVYRGPFVYGRSAGGALTFGSAAIAGGRITSAGVQYHVTDHLGSVVAATGTIRTSSQQAHPQPPPTAGTSPARKTRTWTSESSTLTSAQGSIAPASAAGLSPTLQAKSTMMSVLMPTVRTTR